jgi:thymidylate synthase
MKNKLDESYISLLEDIVNNGTDKQDRTGTGTISVFGRQIVHSMADGFPILTTKKMAWKQIVVELLWFLRGDTNIQFLVKNECNIWNGDAYKNYINKYEKGGVAGIKLEDGTERAADINEFIRRIKADDKFADEWGDLGPIYGAQWRSWNKYNDYIDQIKVLIEQTKETPDSRRLIVNAWNVGEIDQMVLPPCHYGFQLYTRKLTLKERLDKWSEISDRNIMEFPTGPVTEDVYHKVLDERGIKTRAVSLMWNQRSVDTFLGLPFNISSYGLLLCILANHVDMYPDMLIGNLGDTHLYLNHLDQVQEQMNRESFELPKLRMTLNPKLFDFDELHWSDFYLEDYKCNDAIKAPLSN